MERPADAIPTADEAVVAALLRLRKFLEAQEHLKAFNDFDAAFAAHETKAARAAALPGELGAITVRIAALARSFFFLLRVNETKIHFIAQSLVSAAETRNSLVFAAMTRALVEHLAAGAFQEEKLRLFVGVLADQSQAKKIERILEDAEAVVARCYYGKNPRGDESGPKAIPIGDLIPALGKWVGDIREVYRYLCDFVHPNWGSNLIVSTGELGKGQLSPPLQFHHVILRKVCGYTIQALDLVDKLSVEVTHQLLRLQDVVDKSLLPGATLGSIFSVRFAHASGDGLSIATAIHFPGARTPSEGVRMIYEYLAEKNYRVMRREIAALDAGFIVDVFTTERGKVYFKTPTVRA